MRNMTFWLTIFVVAIGAVLVGCNESGLASKPRAEFTQLACLDANEDGRINAADAFVEGSLPDFNADGDEDVDDVPFLAGVDIALNSAAMSDACRPGADRLPEYLVAHDFFSGAEVACGEPALLVLGIAGGVDDLKDGDQAAGVRDIVDALVEEADDEDMDTIGIVAGSAFYGAENAHTAMEDWLTNAVRVHLDRYPCLRVVLVGFSHGGVTAEVVAGRLEAQYPQRIAATVVLDRVEEFYNGDVATLPVASPLINVFQRNDGFAGDPVDGANVENIDASAEEAPRDGHDGGPMEPIRHVTLDNAESVRERIVHEVMERAR